MNRFVFLILMSLANTGCGYDDGTSTPPSDAQNPGMQRDGTAPGFACSNGIDDDCDGLVDFAGGDPGCANASDTSERGAGLICDDGIDNDGDGAIDFVVPGCGSTTGDPNCSSPGDMTERIGL